MAFVRIGNSVSLRRLLPVVALLAVILLCWRWLWGGCWSPLVTTCFEGPSREATQDHIVHYYGWLAYAFGDPLTLLPPVFSNWTWPISVPLLYADIIPIAAVLLRPLAHLLELKFQYFSMCALASMLVSGFCGYVVGSKVLGARSYGFTLGLLLALSPPAILRLIEHEALGLHAVLVSAITLLILRKSNIAIWGILIFLAVGIHAYFLPLLLPFLIIRLASHEITPSVISSKIASIVIPSSSYRKLALISGLARIVDGIILLFIALLGLVAFGYASGERMALIPGITMWSANIVALFDSQGHSSILSPLKMMPYQSEGFSYLGLIVIVSVSVGIYDIIHGPKKSPNGNSTSLFPSPRLYWMLIIAMFIYSLGLDIYLGSQKIISIGGIAKTLHVDRIYYIFRATGRFTWPIYYSLLFWGFHAASRLTRNSSSLVAVILVLLLETHIPTLHFTKAVISKHYIAGLQWKEMKTAAEKTLAERIARSDVFLNATGNPWFRLDALPQSFVQASNPQIYTNYRPYLARLPASFVEFNSRKGCDLAKWATTVSKQNAMRNPLLLMNDNDALNCTEIVLRKELEVQAAGVSIYSGKIYSKD
jgi:hypothetical protein